MKELCASCWENRVSTWLWRARGTAPRSSALQRRPQPWPLYPQESLSAAKGQARASKGLDRSQGVPEDQDLLSTRGMVMRRDQDGSGSHPYSNGSPTALPGAASSGVILQRRGSH